MLTEEQKEKQEIKQTAWDMKEKYGGPIRARQAAKENAETMKGFPKRMKFWGKVKSAI